MPPSSLIYSNDVSLRPKLTECVFNVFLPKYNLIVLHGPISVSLSAPVINVKKPFGWTEVGVAKITKNSFNYIVFSE